MSPAGASRLVAVANLSAVPFLLVLGMTVAHLGALETLIAGSVVLTLGFLALAVSRTIGQSVAALVLIGAGGAALGIGSLVLMPHAFFPNEPAAAVNVGALFWTLGALLTPAWLGGSLRKWGLRQSLLAAALVSLLPGLTVALTALPSSRPTPEQLGPVLDAPSLWLAALVLFLHIPLEMALTAWSTRYLTEEGHQPRLASALNVGFWLSFLLARLATALFLGQDRLLITDVEPWVIFGLAVATAVILGNMAGTDSPRGASIGLILVGAGLGPVLPTLLGLVYRAFPAGRGLAVGLVWAVGSLGGVLLPPLLGVSAQKTAPEALRVPMVLALLVAAGALVLALAL
jgi:fucose permease